MPGISDALLRGERRVISVTGDAFSRDFPLRAVARRAVRFRGDQNIGCVAALPRGMANAAIERFLCRRVDLMLRVIEICLRHPAIDQNRFCD